MKWKCRRECAALRIQTFLYNRAEGWVLRSWRFTRRKALEKIQIWIRARNKRIGKHSFFKDESEEPPLKSREEVLSAYREWYAKAASPTRFPSAPSISEAPSTISRFTSRGVSWAGSMATGRASEMADSVLSVSDEQTPPKPRSAAQSFVSNSEFKFGMDPTPETLYESSIPEDLDPWSQGRRKPPAADNEDRERLKNTRTKFLSVFLRPYAGPDSFTGSLTQKVSRSVDTPEAFPILREFSGDLSPSLQQSENEEIALSLCARKIVGATAGFYQASTDEDAPEAPVVYRPTPAGMHRLGAPTTCRAATRGPAAAAGVTVAVGGGRPVPVSGLSQHQLMVGGLDGRPHKGKVDRCADFLLRQQKAEVERQAKSQRMQELRAEHEALVLDGDGEVCLFRPRINQRSRKLKRSIDDLHEWKSMNSRKKEEGRRICIQQQQDMTRIN